MPCLHPRYRSVFELRCAQEGTESAPARHPPRDTAGRCPPEIVYVVREYTSKVTIEMPDCLLRQPSPHTLPFLLTRRNSSLAVKLVAWHQSSKQRLLQHSGIGIVLVWPALRFRSTTARVLPQDVAEIQIHRLAPSKAAAQATNGVKRRVERVIRSGSDTMPKSAFHGV